MASAPTRRAVVRGAAWSVPAIAVVAAIPESAAASEGVPATSVLSWNFGRTLVDYYGSPAIQFNGAEISVTGYTGTPVPLRMSVRFHERNYFDADGNVVDGKTLTMGAFDRDPVGWTMTGVRVPGGYSSLTYTSNFLVTSDGAYTFPYGIYFGCNAPDQYGNFDFDFTADGYYPTFDVLVVRRPPPS